MARIPYVEEQDHPELAELIQRIKDQRGGRLLNLYKLLLQSPEVADGWLHMFTAIRQRASLDARTRELVIMHVAVLNGADYEYQAHAPLAIQAGLTQQQVDALPTWRTADVFDERDRAVLAYCESMTREVHVPDGVFAPLPHHYNAQEILELTTTIAGYNAVSRVLEALQVDPQS